MCVTLIMSLIMWVIMGTIFGIATNAIIRNRGYNENWFWWGFFFLAIAMLVALSKPERVTSGRTQESVGGDVGAREASHGQSAYRDSAVHQIDTQKNETVERKEEKKDTGKADISKIPIAQYNHAPKLKPVFLSGQPCQEQCAFVLKLKCYREKKISAVMVDIVFYMAFGGTYEIHDLGFTNFEYTRNSMTSGMTLYPLPQAQFILIQRADIIIKKLIEDGQTIELSEEEKQLSPYEEELEGESVQEEVIREAETLKGAIQIYNYLKNYNLENNQILDEELLNIAKHNAGLERMYGNAKDECMREIKAYFEEEQR